MCGFLEDHTFSSTLLSGAQNELQCMPYPPAWFRVVSTSTESFMTHSLFCSGDPMSNISVIRTPGSRKLEFHKLYIKFCLYKVDPSHHASAYPHDGYSPLNLGCPSKAHMQKGCDKYLP
jgi:hypothetical protein